MRRIVLFFSVFVVVAAIAVSVMAAVDSSIIKVAEVKLRSLEQIGFNNLVPDQLIRRQVQAVIKDISRMSYDVSYQVNAAARQEAFKFHFCNMFADGDQCYDACYAAWSDSGESQRWRVEKLGVPVELMSLLQKLRTRLMEKGREYLSQPDNVRAFYQAKKLIIIEEMSRHPECRQEILSWLQGVEKAFQGEGDDSYAFRFAERRRSEGGNDLVQAYIDIAQDLQKSL